MERRFLGWERPALHAVADFLIERYLDGESLRLGRVIVVVPGARAGRRLLELLVERSDDRGVELVPPRILTASALPAEVIDSGRPLAGELTRRLLWSRILQEWPRDELARIVPSPPAPDDPAGWLALAETVSRLERELATEGIELADVAREAASLDPFLDEDRWRVLGRLERAYAEGLDELGVADPHRLLLDARARGAREGRDGPGKDIVLASTSDLGRATRRLLEEVDARVTALIFAPETHAERFDRQGCVIPERWTNAPIDIPRERIIVTDRPGDQAASALEVIASWNERYAAEDITLGVPDPTLVPYIEQRMRLAGLPFHDAAGRSLERTAPYRLLETVADYLDRGSFRELASLARHPDIESWYEEKRRAATRRRGTEEEEAGGRGTAGEAQGARARAPDDLLPSLDRYLTEHLQEEVSSAWLGPSRKSRTIKKFEWALEKLIEPLRGGPRPLPSWAAPVRKLLLDVYDRRPFDRGRPDDRRALDIFARIHAALEEVHELDPRIAPALAPGEALRTILSHLRGARVPDPPESAAIEVLGWLELPLDDAPALVVTGFNDEHVPGSSASDAFLPDSLRRHIGLDHDERRHARDAHALSATLASRERVVLISGRARSDSEPLRPSRLLFACGGEELLERARVAFPEEDPGREMPPLLRAGKSVLEFPLPPPRPGATIESLRVTAFRDYLTCPYGFYLRHIERLETLDDSSEELDGRAFGTLAHAVLEEFAGSGCALSTGEAEIASALEKLLDHVMRKRYGKRARAAVLVQGEQVRERLRAFARWQARWRAAGWRIEHIEADVRAQHGVHLDVDGEPILLRGRIDRIDRNERTGERVLFDYKTGEAGDDPERTHRRRGEWVDLQLPLYRHLVTAEAYRSDAPLRLGYIVLPKDVARTGERLAAWTEDELDEADEKARWVVRRIREGAFDPSPDRPPGFFQEFGPLYQDGLVVSRPVPDGADTEATT